MPKTTASVQSAASTQPTGVARKSTSGTRARSVEARRRRPGSIQPLEERKPTRKRVV
jgi:hypothetical protein